MLPILCVLYVYTYIKKYKERACVISLVSKETRLSDANEV